MAGTHALLSPSAAEKWMGCPGSLLMEKGEVDKGSAHADEGTAAHFLASECLAYQAYPAAHLKKRIEVMPEGARWQGDLIEGPWFEVDSDMANHVEAYVSVVRGYAKDGALFIEQRLPITTWTGEPDAAGTSDAVVLTSDGELIVVDLKYGMGELVSPERNKQLMIYALAAYEEFSMVGDIKTVRLVIHQPRVHHAPQEWPVSVQDLALFGDEVRVAAKAALTCYNEGHEILAPSDAACRWCKAGEKCPARIKQLTAAIGADFEDLTKPDAQVPPVGTGPTLAQKMAACDLIEKWIKAVRGKVEAELFAGNEVPGYKLVMGKKGARAWLNADDAEATLKSMRLKVEEMYDMKVISPTSAEKIFGDKGTAPSVKRWNKLQGLITQTDGKPSVAPESDKRAAYVVDAVGAFEDETGSDMA
jgi:hypothetical protein